ncbi:hypothetical protein [Streptomyces apocyni]|uniref:hypothetical protein n=1 Tax=Streptomyces apocyni TaxID=2654677 RepID=UPI0012EA94D9|nr:hypothetical protein [Streptomyces apocyni]
MNDTDPIETAELALRELREALAGAGVTLPSMRIDLASCARDVPTPQLDLGRCTPRDAVRLAAVLQWRVAVAAR